MKQTDPERKVHTAEYDGPDRRHSNGRRPEDFVANNLKLLGVALGIGLTIFSMGGAWVAAKMALNDKVDRTEWVEKNAEQDQQRAKYKAEQDAEWVEKNAEQDQQRAKYKAEQDAKNTALGVRQDRFENIILVDVIPTLKRLDNRVSAIYCENKSAGCQ